MSGRPAGSRAWLAWALASLLGFALTNFILGYVAEMSAGAPGASVKAVMILCLGCGLPGVIGALVFKARGRGFSRMGGGKFPALPVAAGCSLALGMLLLKSSLAANPLAKGPIVAVTSSNALVVALLAWALLRERLSPVQGAGFLVVVSGVALIGLSGGGRAHLAAVGLAVAAMLLFGITNFLLKLAGARGCDSLAAAVVLWLAVGACGVLAAGGCWLVHGVPPLLGSAVLSGLSLLAGVFLALGMLGIKRAVTLGQAGPAAAVSGANAILVGLLDLALLGHMLAPLKLAGMLLAVTGIVSLSLARPLPKA